MVHSKIKTKSMFIEASGRFRLPIVRLEEGWGYCNKWIDVVGVSVDRKILYVVHANQVRNRMSEVVSKISGLCRKNGRMDKRKIRGIGE